MFFGPAIVTLYIKLKCDGIMCSPWIYLSNDYHVPKTKIE
jgi:hypothetical protein